MFARSFLGFSRQVCGRPAAVLGILLGTLLPVVADTYSINGTQILRNGANWIGGGVDAFDQTGIQGKQNYPFKLVREVVQDVSECPIYSSDGTISNALGYLHPLQDVVNYNRSHGAVTILCPFGWDAGTNRILVGATPSATDYYPQFKQRLAAIAQAFTNSPDVWIDVWNEPYAWDNTGFAESQWVSDMTDLYDTIRQAGNTNIVLIPGQANDAQETVLLDQKAFLNGKYNVLATIHCYNGWTLGTQPNSESRIQSIHNAGWALIFAEVGRDKWSFDCTALLNAAVQSQVSSLAWSWSASDGSSLVTNGGPTDWGNQFFPYLPLFVPITGVPPPPTSLMGSSNVGEAMLTWMPSAGAGSYNVKRSTVSGQNYSLVGSGLPIPGYTDTNVTGGTIYYYVVSAVDAAGEGSNSVELSVRVPVTSVVDDADPAGVAITGAWSSSTYTAGYFGPDYLQDGNTGTVGGKSVRFTPNLPYAGTYQVCARWTTGSNRATNAPIDVISADGTNTFYVNQQQSNGVWVLLGTFDFNAGTNGSVVVRNDGANGYVIADAVEFLSTGFQTQAPGLVTVPNQVILAGRSLQVTNTVNDPNLPPLPLTFRLLTGPGGSSINFTSGLISWRPAIAQGNTTNQFVVAVNDPTTPSLGATQRFTATVLAPAQPLLQSASVAHGVFGVTVTGDAGPDYSVQVSTNLVDWQVLVTSNSPALPLSVTDAGATNSAPRFYRVQLGP